MSEDIVSSLLSCKMEWINIFMKRPNDLHNIIDRLSSYIDTYGPDSLRPNPRLIFRAFHKLSPDDVEIIFLAESPYPGVCKISGIPYADGLSFDIQDGTESKPKSFEVLERNFATSGMEPGDNFRYLEDNGVLMLNAALSIGMSKNKYVDDHTYLWKSFIANIISSITIKPKVLATFGRVADEFIDYVNINSSFVSFPHPAARIEDPLRGRFVLGELANMQFSIGVEHSKFSNLVRGKYP